MLGGARPEPHGEEPQSGVSNHEAAARSAGEGSSYRSALALRRAGWGQSLPPGLDDVNLKTFHGRCGFAVRLGGIKSRRLASFLWIACGGPRRRGELVGENAMRAVLAIWVLIALCASANAATRGHPARSRDVIVRSPQTPSSTFVTPSGQRLIRDPSVPGGLRSLHDDPPSVNDPSRFGGA